MQQLTGFPYLQQSVTISLILTPKTNANKAGAIGLVSEKYDDQICSAANIESQSAAASDLIGCNESYSQ